MNCEPLKKVCKIYNGNSINADFKKKNFAGRKEGYPFIATKDVSFSGSIDYDNGVRIPYDTKFKIAPAGSIFICSEGGSAGRKIARVSEPVCFGNKLFCLVPGDRINSDYLYHYLLSDKFQSQFKFLMSGLIGGVSAKKFGDITIEFPSPECQKSIVTKLDAAFTKIDRIKDNAKSALDEAILLFDTALNATFSDNSGWEEHRLDELCSIESRLVDPTAECFARIPHIGGANITSTTGHLIDVKAVEDEDLSSGKYFFEENVVLYNKIRPYLKKVALPTTCGLCSADMYPLTPKKGTDRDFLRFLLLTKHFTDYAISGSARAGMPKVNRKHLFAYSCYTPSLEKQKLIASNLRSLLANIEELQKNEDSILKECETLKQAVLKQVFEINN